MLIIVLSIAVIVHNHSIIITIIHTIIKFIKERKRIMKKNETKRTFEERGFEKIRRFGLTFTLNTT